jgi:hypothetical protein
MRAAGLPGPSHALIILRLQDDSWDGRGVSLRAARRAALFYAAGCTNIGRQQPGLHGRTLAQRRGGSRNEDRRSVHTGVTSGGQPP